MSMRWPPVTFTVGMSNLSTTSAIARSSLATGHPAPHARHDRVRAVLLDVGVDALVDEARLVVVGILAGPVADEVVVERRPALGAAARRLPLQFLHHRRHRLQRLRDDQAAHVVVAQRRAGAHRLDGAAIVGVAQGQLHELLDEAGAGAARGRGLGVRANLVEGRQPLLRDRAGDPALADAVAAADLGIVRQSRDGRRGIERAAALERLARRSACRASPRCSPTSS